MRGVSTPQPSEGWQLDGSTPQAYEKYLVPGLFAPWAERLLDEVKVEPGERVLDVACGTGIVARRAALRIGEMGRVIGVDVNDAMLATAEAEGADGPQIEWRRGDALDLPFENDSFDLVLCQQAMQFFPDPEAALKQMHRVLRPTGRLGLNVLRSLRHNPAYEVMAEALDRHAGAEAGTMMRSPFAGWERGDLCELARDAGFSDVRVIFVVSSMRYPSVAEFLRREAASSPLAGPLTALEDDVRDALLAELDESLEPWVDDGGVVFPTTTTVVVARP